MMNRPHLKLKKQRQNEVVERVSDLRDTREDGTFKTSTRAKLKFDETTKILADLTFNRRYSFVDPVKNTSSI